VGNLSSETFVPPAGQYGLEAKTLISLTAWKALSRLRWKEMITKRSLSSDEMRF